MPKPQSVPRSKNFLSAKQKKNYQLMLYMEIKRLTEIHTEHTNWSERKPYDILNLVVHTVTTLL